MPDHFPESPVMFVAHNFDSKRAFDKARKGGGRVSGQFWTKLIAILDAASLPPENCFFTNAQMGFKPGSATGSMPSVAGYQDQCLHFLEMQVEIVMPRAIVALGDKAENCIARLKMPYIKLRHPSNWYFLESISRGKRLRREGRMLARRLASGMGVSETSAEFFAGRGAGAQPGELLAVLRKAPNAPSDVEDRLQVRGPKRRDSR
jgi:hypothetical protein